MKREVIYNELIKLGGGTSRKGFEYILDAVEHIYDVKDFSATLLYEVIAKMNDATSSSVERAIRHYINCLYLIDGHKEELDKLNCALNKYGVPINSEFIKTFARYLKYNVDKEN